MWAHAWLAGPWQQATASTAPSCSHAHTAAASTAPAFMPPCAAPMTVAPAHRPSSAPMTAASTALCCRETWRVGAAVHRARPLPHGSPRLVKCRCSAAPQAAGWHGIQDGLAGAVGRGRGLPAARLACRLAARRPAHVHRPRSAAGIDFKKGFSDQVARLAGFMQQHGLIDCQLAPGVLRLVAGPGATGLGPRAAGSCGVRRAGSQWQVSAGHLQRALGAFCFASSAAICSQQRVAASRHRGNPLSLPPLIPNPHPPTRS